MTETAARPPGVAGSPRRSRTRSSTRTAAAARGSPRSATTSGTSTRDYWARPVPAFGDPKPRILIVGLAPGLHGANRTGRPFTGRFRRHPALRDAACGWPRYAAGIGLGRRPAGAARPAHHQRRQVPAAAEQAAAGRDRALQSLPEGRARGAAVGARAARARAHRARCGARCDGHPARRGTLRPWRRASPRERPGAGRFVSLQPLQHQHAAPDAADVPGRRGARGRARGALAPRQVAPMRPAHRFDGKAFVATLPRRPGVYRMSVGRRRADLRRQGREPARSRRQLFQPGQPEPEGAGAGRADRLDRGDGHQLRDRGAAARVQPDQGAQAALQRRAARRQELSLHLARHVARISRASRPIAGSRSLPGRYFGPFPSAGAVNETLHHLQKLFRLRNCRDSFFDEPQPPLPAVPDRPLLRALRAAHRSREAYAARRRGGGQGARGPRHRGERRPGRADGGGRATASTSRRAARLRDQLAALKEIQAQQVVAAEGERDADVFAIVGEPGNYAVSVMLVRGGRSLGTSGFFPRGALAEPAEALASFIMQYYAEREPPPEIFADASPDESAPAVGGADPASPGHAVRVKRAQRGMAARWVELVARERRAVAADAPARSAMPRRDVGSAAPRTSASRRRRRAWNASTSATRRARARSPPAWCSAPRVR